MLIEALPAVARRVPDVTLDVVGSPRMPIEPLRERARALGVDGRDHAGICASCPTPRCPALLARARVVALPYRWIEGSGVFATRARAAACRPS